MCQFVQRMWMWVFAVVALTGCSKESLSFKSVDITGANDAQAFALRDAQGQVRQLADFKGKALVVNLKYGPNRERSIAGIKRVSKPGLRVYARSSEIPTVLGGLGIAILSTSSGLLTDREAESKGVGGEVLAYVW